MKHEYSADEIFELSVDSKAVFPLNLEFAKRKEFPKFKDTGIFFLAYKDELIYIGYSVKEDAILRMRKQLEGITLRGKNLIFNDSCILVIQNSKTLNPFFPASILNQQKSTETSLKRILFAEQHWKDFVFLDQYILRNFIFHWFPLDSDVAKKCDELKQQLLPRCNQEGVLPSEYENILKSIN
jgi:hypothetical protein